jgi:hypothetical protein
MRPRNWGCYFSALIGGTSCRWRGQTLESQLPRTSLASTIMPANQ